MELPYTGTSMRTDVELHRPKGKPELHNLSADEEASPPGRNMDQRAPTPRSHVPPTNMRYRSLRPSSPQEEDFRGFPEEEC
ncbi:hypothetical protein PR048_030661 [Dryococelus australis]|uniref:Uncharacterized protein n=1 Tax=Dryococelus australis TaxID=614101 RepID=A0ABQ9GDE7_9NEOP|nr:hypothetical protein PR048_030661 [Dryococelus australis]